MISDFSKIVPFFVHQHVHHASFGLGVVERVVEHRTVRVRFFGGARRALSYVDALQTLACVYTDGGVATPSTSTGDALPYFPSQSVYHNISGFGVVRAIDTERGWTSVWHRPVDKVVTYHTQTLVQQSLLHVIT
jgi:hypothetical protein